MSLFHAIFQPGLFSNPAVRSAAAVGALVAIVCAPAGVFAVMRGHSFAGHAFSDIAATGGSLAVLLSISPLFGFVAMSMAGGAAIEVMGGGRGGRSYSGERPGAGDVATGTVLGAGLGLTALLLYLTTTFQSTTGTAVTVLFGSLFTVSSSLLVPVAAFGAGAVALLAAVHRPLLLASVNPELAAIGARRLSPAARSRAIGTAYMTALALSVALSSLSIGAILSTALLVGPAAAALRLAKSPGRAVICAAVIGAFAVLAGIVLAYDSYTWPPSHTGWPVSFFVVSIVLVIYFLSGVWSSRQGRSLTALAKPTGA